MSESIEERRNERFGKPFADRAWAKALMLTPTPVSGEDVPRSVTKAERAVGLAFMTYVDTKHKRYDAHVSVDVLMLDTGLSHNGVGNALKGLRRKGWLELTEFAIPRRGMAAVHRLTFPKWWHARSWDELQARRKRLIKERVEGRREARGTFYRGPST